MKDSVIGVAAFLYIAGFDFFPSASHSKYYFLNPVSTTVPFGNCRSYTKLIPIKDIPGLGVRSSAYAQVECMTATPLC